MNLREQIMMTIASGIIRDQTHGEISARVLALFRKEALAMLDRIATSPTDNGRDMLDAIAVEIARLAN